MANQINSIFSGFGGYSSYSSYNAFNSSNSPFGGMKFDNKSNGVYGDYRLYDTLSKQYIDYGKNTAQYKTPDFNMQGIKTIGDNLMSALAGISSARNSFAIQANSSDRNIATFTSDNSNAPSMTLQVDQMATSQINTGNSLYDTGKAITSGNYSFVLESGGRSTLLSVSVGATDNNRSILQRVANQINSSDLGVSATIERDAKTGRSTLSLSSTEEGTENSFTIFDYSGDLASKLGIDEVDQYAQDAIYTIDDGEQQISSSNTIDMGNGVTAQIVGQSGQPVTFSMGADTSAIAESVNDMVNALNDALDYAQSSQGRGSSRLENDIRNLGRSYSSSLSKLGIEVSRDGHFSVNSEKLEKAIDNGQLQKVFSQRYGFANRANRIAGNMQQMQQNSYYSNPAPRNNLTYYNNLSLVNSYSASIGSLFDAVV